MPVTMTLSMAGSLTSRDVAGCENATLDWVSRMAAPRQMAGTAGFWFDIILPLFFVIQIESRREYRRRP